MRRLIASALVLAALTAGSAGAATQRSAATTTISVKAGEFYFKLSKHAIAKPATVVFAVKNVGRVAHDLKIAGKKTALIKPGKSAKLKVVFKKAGKYRYLCTVPGHAAAGMEGTFVVH
jgi:nitrite reductase (NO-forming)